MRTLLDRFRNEVDFRKTVFLKPNIVFPVNDRSGEITRLIVVRSVVEVLREDYGTSNIVIGEGTAAGTDPLRNFRVSGHKALADQLDVDLVDLHSVERISVDWKYGAIRLPRLLSGTTYINLPILKESSAALMSGAMKNQKGLLSPEAKKSFHRLGLHEPIAALTAVIQPSLTIMDGSNFFLNDLLMAGTNVYEVDSLATTLLGIDEPEYLKAARVSVGIGGCEVVGRELAIRNKKPFGFNKYKKYFGLRLWSNPAACSMCRFSLESIRHWPDKDYYHSFRVYAKLLKWSCRGADFVFGKNPQYDRGAKNIICIGNCTRELAKSENYIHVPGCPPTRADLSRNL